VHEYILIFSKYTYARLDIKKKSTISKEEFLEFTKSVWTFSAESATKIGHPAPFPLELPYRLIQLYSFENDIILDPFMGSGQTALAALQTNRHFVGYDINPKYVQLAETRIEQYISKNKSPNLFEYLNLPQLT
jgi:site-specific DNA-methyltransferase (adenine-specific)